MNVPAIAQQIPALAPFIQNADHIDDKTAVSEQSLRAFIAGMLNYQPAWLSFLWAIRTGLAAILGIRSLGAPRRSRLAPTDVPIEPGKRAAFFTVRAAQEDHYWIAGADDNHLAATLAVVAEPLTGERKRYHVLTIVTYRRWTGPVYFNIIRPFHHLVVGAMVRAGQRAKPAFA